MKGKALKTLTLLLLLAFLMGAAWKVHPAGYPGMAVMDDYFLGNGQEQTGSNNIVAAVMFDYRGLDTLGEASVLFAAAAGVYLALGRRRDEE